MGKSRQKAEELVRYTDFPDELSGIGCAVPFEMLNYGSIYIRVEADSKLKILRHGTVNKQPVGFNYDGCHVPIVDLATGRLFWMAAIKPCRIVEKK